MATYQTDPQPLEITGSDMELQFHPLPVLAAIDEFLGLGAKLDSTGALDLLMTSGSGMKPNPKSWDVADAALILKALVVASGEGKGSDVMVDICKRYGVQRKRDGTWEPVETTSGLNSLGTDSVFVVFACLNASFTPFSSRLGSSAKATAETSAQLSPVSAKAV